MVKWYVFSIIILTSSLSSILSSQEIKTFKVEDFDLIGEVKSALVITDYGKEEYHFDQKGRLSKAVTRYSDDDYENTFYRYRNGELIEKRVENYHDNTFDPATSIANLYEFDTTGLKRQVVENIVSYEQEALEKNIYHYDDTGALIKIVHTDTNGTDEITIEYTDSEDASVMIKKRNNVLLQSVRREKIDSVEIKIVTDDYINGDLSTRKKEILRKDNLIFEAEFAMDSVTQKWLPQSEVHYVYDKDGVLSEVTTKRGLITTAEHYIYQFDGSRYNNWVKEIVTPDNTYTTRRIVYYETPENIED
ncbi:hypothetical protein [Pareuzebyella sediminis]|uniref:hypothetical protein n=1 Tax=Pareuzebyella sediminis TaxID=2607998 RepID=UPI0011ECF1CB|nr:hypothetical protein [Pareuzebyella sediminis]